MFSRSSRLRALLIVSALGACAASATVGCTGPDQGRAASDHAGRGTAGATPAAVREQSAPAPGRKLKTRHIERQGAGPDMVQPFAAGSLIIPMDVTYQDAGMLKAFGLLDKLLRASIPVSWVVDPNKTVVNAATGTFTVDMTASATDFKTGAVITSYGYRGGPFVIDSSNAAQATPIIQSWQKTNTTTVHVASASFDAPVSRLLTVAPRIAVFNDNNQQIAFSYLNAAGILDENGLAWSNSSVNLLTDTAVTGTLGNAQDGVLFDGTGGPPVFCEIMTMHWDVTSTDIPGVVAEMNSFLNYPVHVNAECQAVNAIEGDPPDGGREDWLTTKGYQWPAPKQPTAVQFANSFQPFAQMDGPFATVGGSEPAYGFAAGSSYYYQDVVMISGAGVGVGVQDLWMTGYAHGNCDIGKDVHRENSGACGGKVSYLGGHQYQVNTPMSKNPQSQGARLFLNSLYEAGCVTSEGQPIVMLTKSAPSAVSSASVTYTIEYDNMGPGPALALVITDTIPTGSSFVSASVPGAFSGGAVSWAIGSLGSNASGQVSFTVTLPAKGTYTNQASGTFRVGNNTQSATSNTTTTVWGACANDGDCPTSLVCDTSTSQCVQCTVAEPQNCVGLGICLPDDTCGCGVTSDCPSGDTCVGGVCETCAESCTSGCCAGSTCTTPATGACGLGGATCVVCDPSAADSCTAGACTCGSRPACGAGQRCVGGACVCDAVSCAAGCCSGTTCNVPTSGACGVGGVACTACDPGLSDGCASGQCTCGSGLACASGQACVGSTCVCNASSCPSGCCNGNVCTSPSPGACGTGGAACVACSGGSACANGSCQGCSQTCASGCCTGNTCNAPSMGTCGTGGAACAACDPGASNSCTGGVCACGSGSACPSGQACVGGVCVCNAASCPNGCCNGDVCTSPSSSACGTGGAVCVACTGGDACVNGACGGCSQTCLSGCCSGNACNSPSTETCGTGGAACVACDPKASDSCTSGTCTCGSGAACGQGQACVGGTCAATDAGTDGGGSSGSASGSASASGSGTGVSSTSVSASATASVSSGVSGIGSGSPSTSGSGASRSGSSRSAGSSSRQRGDAGMSDATPDGSPGEGVGTPAGCGCRTASSAPAAPSGLVLAFVSLGAAFARRRRRSLA